MAAYRLALRESTQTAKAALQPLERARHSQRAASYPGHWGGRCIRIHYAEGILASMTMIKQPNSFVALAEDSIGGGHVRENLTYFLWI
mgnify:CR=1 FL=1